MNLLIQILNDQSKKVITNPDSISGGLYLSRTAGSTTEANDTKLISDAMSDNFSSWDLLNLGNTNSIN